MTEHIWAFVTAGAIGALVSVVHGLATQKLMITPILSQTEFPEAFRKLVPLLLHFSTICWFVGGVALIVGPFWLDSSAMLTIAVTVGIFYLIGAIGNLWGTKGRHPGWVLLGVAVFLIAYAAAPMI